MGYAAEGTLARIIIDGAKTVKLFGREIRVKARIHTINGFSAHVGATDLLAWHRGTGTPERTFLVHGEQGPLDGFARRLGRHGVEIAETGKVYTL